MLQHFPPEINQKIYDEVGGDWATLVALGSVCRGLACHIRPSLSLTRVPHSLTLPLPSDRLLSTTTRMLGTWPNHIRQLNLSGNKHTPATFFQFLSLFIRLESLVLRSFSFGFKRNDTLFPWPRRRYSLPPTLAQLSLIQSPSMLASLERHLKRGGSALRDVYIQAVFSFDQPEILSMLESIKNLQGVNTLTLDALYDELDDHIGIDMTRHILLPRTFTRISGLRHLRLNLAKVPSRVAMLFLGSCTVHSPHHDLALIDIYVPTSPNLWQGTNPSHELDATLDGMELYSPVVRPPANRRARLVVRGFPDPLPQHLQEWGGSAVSEPYGYPLSFEGCDWEQVTKARLEVI